MARVNTVGLQELIKDLNNREDATRRKVEKTLERGAELIAEATRLKAMEHGLKKTGKMIDSIAPGPLKIYSDSAEVDIWPQGTRETRHGRKTNAVVGFVQHYGRQYNHKKGGPPTKRPGTYFFDEASDSVADIVAREADKIWHDEE